MGLMTAGIFLPLQYIPKPKTKPNPTQTMMSPRSPWFYVSSPLGPVTSMPGGTTPAAAAAAAAAATSSAAMQYASRHDGGGHAAQAAHATTVPVHVAAAALHAAGARK
jgi:hypothetical protein